MLASDIRYEIGTALVRESQPLRPLQNFLVLDFTTLLPGPMATLLPVEAGAAVLKIDRPGGEDMRNYAPH